MPLRARGRIGEEVADLVVRERREEPGGQQRAERFFAGEAVRAGADGFRADEAERELRGVFGRVRFFPRCARSGRARAAGSGAQRTDVGKRVEHKYSTSMGKDWTRIGSQEHGSCPSIGR